MPRIYQSVDHVEVLTDTMMEQFGNERTYHWDNGCELSYSATDMTVTIGEGRVTHNGNDVPVAGDTATLSSDPNNPRWVHIGVNSSGGITIVLGTAAADPVPPELTDLVELALVKVEAGQTIASACAYKLDKRMKGKSLVQFVTGTGSTTQSLVSDVQASGTIAAVSGLTLALGANSTYLIDAQLIIRASSAGSYYLSFNGPGGATLVVIKADGTALGQDNASLLTTFAASEVRNVRAFISVTTTTAGNFTVSHIGTGRTMKAKSQVELI